MKAPSDRPPSTPPDAGARLPALTPAGRELLEVLWSASRPLTTRQLQDAIAQRYPHRGRRKINTTSSLLAALLETGWVVGRKRGGTRWVYEAAVIRDAGMLQLARRVVEELSVEPGDGWYLVWAALGALDLGERVPLPGRRPEVRRWQRGAAAYRIGVGFLACGRVRLYHLLALKVGGSVSLTVPPRRFGDLVAHAPPESSSRPEPDR